MIIPAAALISMGLLSSLGSYYLKKSTADGLNPRMLLRSPALYLGGTLYVVSALLNYYLLQILPYSLVVPLGALTYVWTLLIAASRLKEKISPRKIIGVGFILVGVLLAALGTDSPRM